MTVLHPDEQARELELIGIQSMTACPTCHSKDPRKFYAWSTAFGGKRIPWFTCSDKWHSEAEWKNAAAAQPGDKAAERED